MASVIYSLGCVCCGAGGDTVSVGLDLCEGEELVAHVGIGICYWIVWSIDYTSQFNWTSESGLYCWCGVLIVSV
jgi:hypothetical protein